MSFEIETISPKEAAILTVITPKEIGVGYVVKKHLLALPDAADSGASVIAPIRPTGMMLQAGRMDSNDDLEEQIKRIVKTITFSTGGIIHSGASVVARVVGSYDPRPLDTAGSVTINEKFYREGDLVFITPVKVTVAPYVKKDALTLSGWVVCDTEQKDTYNTFVALGAPPAAGGAIHSPIIRITNSLPHRALFDDAGKLRELVHAQEIEDVKGSNPFAAGTHFSSVAANHEEGFEVQSYDDGTVLAYPVWVTLSRRADA